LGFFASLRVILSAEESYFFMKVVLIGKGKMFTNLLEGLLDAGSDIVGILRYEKIQYPKWKLLLKDFFNPSHEKTIINQHKLHEIQCNSANSEAFKKELIKLNTDILLVGTWGEKLRKEIINVPAIASVNVHPSILPKYRGPNPYLQNILHRETFSGITFHLMDENFDTGAILSQKKIKIFPNDTSKELKARTVFQARLMCAELMKKLEYGMVIPVAQNEKDMSYYPNINDYDKMLDFKKETAEEIQARIRALYPWLPAYVTYKDKFFIPNPYKLKIIKANTGNLGDIINTDYKINSITVQCPNGRALKMDDVKLYGFFNKPFTKSYIKRIKI